MDSGKTEISKDDSKNKSRRRLKRLGIWLLIDLTVAVVIIAMLLHRPGRYKPMPAGDLPPGQVHPYLTHLSSELYNGAQRRGAFDLTITQESINQVVVNGGWPKESRGILLYAPMVLLEAGRMELMGTAEVEGVRLVVSIEIAPVIEADQKISLNIVKFKVGAMNVTPLAKMVAKQMYAETLASELVDDDALQTRIVASLFNQEAFDPVFTLEDKKIRLQKIIIEKEKLIAHFAPVP